MAWITLLILSGATAQTTTPRPFEQRLIDDGTDYHFGQSSQWCSNGQCSPTDEGGHDILALDVREAYDPTTLDGALYFRITNTGGIPERGTLSEIIHFTLDGTPHQFTFQTTDGTSYTSPDFDAVYTLESPQNTTSAEGMIRYKTLGLTIDSAPGTTLADLRVEGRVGINPADHAPGTWTLHGVTVPDAEGQPTATSYTMQGPATLLELTTSSPIAQPLTNEEPHGHHDDGHDHFNPITYHATLSLTNPLPETAQNVMLTIETTRGYEAHHNLLLIDPLQPGDPLVILEGGTSTEVPLTITQNENWRGTITIQATTPLGGLAQTTIPFNGPAPSSLVVSSGLLTTGQNYTHTFTQAGILEYHCHPHPFMTGHITIEPAATGTSTHHLIHIRDGADEDFATWSFEPATLTIQAGDTVEWINEGQHSHDVRGTIQAEPKHHHDHDIQEPKDTPGTPTPLLLVTLATVALAILKRHHP